MLSTVNEGRAIAGTALCNSERYFSSISGQLAFISAFCSSLSGLLLKKAFHKLAYYMLAVRTAAAVAAYKQLIAVFKGCYKRLFGFYIILPCTLKARVSF